SPNGRRIALLDSEYGIAVWNVDKAKKEATVQESIARNNRSGWPVTMSFSENSRFLLVVQERSARVFDNEAGKWMPKLEGDTELRLTVWGYQHFSAGNELIAIAGEESIARTPGQPSLQPRRFLKIWDVKTGKLLKGWPQ